MTPEQIKELIQKTISGSFKYYWLYFALSVIVSILAALLTSYIKQKGQNLATKQDIANITLKVEEVKADVQKGQEVEKLKRELKYKSLLSSLSIIDAYFSQVFTPPPGGHIKKQIATTEDVRTCHNNLILTCENTEVIKLFSTIMFNLEPQTSPTDLLNRYRNLVRKELGFGNSLDLDRERAWFGHVISDK